MQGFLSFERHFISRITCMVSWVLPPLLASAREVCGNSRISVVQGRCSYDKFTYCDMILTNPSTPCPLYQVLNAAWPCRFPCVVEKLIECPVDRTADRSVDRSVDKPPRSLHLSSCACQGHLACRQSSMPLPKTSQRTQGVGSSRNWASPSCLFRPTFCSCYRSHHFVTR